MGWRRNAASAKHFHVVGDDFGGIAILSILVLPLASLQTPLHEDQRTLAQILAGVSIRSASSIGNSGGNPISNGRRSAASRVAKAPLWSSVSLSIVFCVNTSVRYRDSVLNLHRAVARLDVRFFEKIFRGASICLEL